ncbi:T9SS type A sorting domain-containing protein [Pontibacter vulgaris]|uniref:T9SS type A sorting domain-containing protein n=1 Tax=Pontibacter vulgaris TaxID=2905679 RepID=UPI001FA7DAA3|nr:T9SS type A sorting domain-containing protein [Pontibacter vulgaris]
MKIKLLLPVLGLLLFLPLLSNATHYNGGYISYTVDPKNPLTYNFTFTLFNNDLSTADDPVVKINMGNFNEVIVPRTKVIRYLNYNSIEVFEWQFTYQQPGDYLVYWIGINRNPNIINTMDTSDQLTQFIQTRIQARLTNPNINSVKTIVPAPLEAFTGEPFKMNMITYDADGDRLTYELVPSQYWKDASPQNLPGYFVPEGLTINNAGELTWQNPTTKGEYALSIKITEYNKDEKLMGYTIVDMNLFVKDRQQHPKVSLVNENRLRYNQDGSVLATPDQKLKLEFYVQKAPNSTKPIKVKQFSDLDTLDLLTPSMATRDSAGGFAVTVTLTPNAAMLPNYLYTLGLRGGAAVNNEYAEHQLDYSWDFVSLSIGEPKIIQPSPTSSGDLPENAPPQLYPNPVRGQEFVVEALNVPSILILYTSEGKTVHRVQLEQGKNKVRRHASLAPGLYTYRIIGKGSKAKSGKIILQ